MASPLELWRLFVERVCERLEAGREEHGDRSFERPPAELLGELEQEALDLAGWAFVLWSRIRALHEQTQRTSPQSDAVSPHPPPRIPQGSPHEVEE